MKRHWLLTRHSRVELYVPNLIGDPCPKSQLLVVCVYATKLCLHSSMSGM